MKKQFNRLLALLMAIVMVLSVSIPVRAEDEPGEYAGKTIILSSNDVHGAIEGYAYMAGLKKDLESKGADVILVDAGDFSQGTTYVSESKGASAVEMMNLVGYDYATLGNHEFDFGLEALNSNVDAAKFKILCGDIIDNDTNESKYDATDIYEDPESGLKIGFMGYATPETQTKSIPTNFVGLHFLSREEIFDAESGAQAQINALKEKGADVIVAITHLGVDDESEPYRSTDLYAATEGIDLIIDGHSHTVMEKGENDEPIMSTGTKFMNIGMTIIDEETKKIEDMHLVKFKEKDSDPFPADAIFDEEVKNAADAIIADITERYGAKVAESKVSLNGERGSIDEEGNMVVAGNRNSETNLGDLIADSMMWYIKDQGADLGVDEKHVVAITNGGGIRKPIAIGDVSRQNILDVLPFGNTIAAVTVTGEELLEALEASTYSTPGPVGGFPQIAGMNIEINTAIPYDANEETYPGSTYYGPANINRVTIDDINGEEFDPEAKYVVLTNNFCAAGGDTYYAFAAASSQFDTGITLDEALTQYIVEALDGVVGEDYAEPQGRILLTNEPEEPGEYDGKTIILSSNDVHGAIEGYAYMAGLKADLEEKGADVILVDAGDFSQGTTYVSDSKGASAVEMMNLVGYDYATLGNHEFDFGLEALNSNVEAAEFKILCGDIIDNDTNESKYDATDIYEDPESGLKIGFMGYATPETQTKSIPTNFVGLHFLSQEEIFDAESGAQAQINALKEEGANVIVAITHLGVDPESEPYRSTDLYAATEGIDLIIDGHSHTIMEKGENDEPIMSTGTKFMNIGMTIIDEETKKIEDMHLVKFKEKDSDPFPADAIFDEEVKDAADAIIADINERYGAKVAESKVELNGDRGANDGSVIGNRNGETNLGDLITDSMMWYVKDQGADLGVDEKHVVAITNGGGIRAAIHVGDVTRNNILTVLPFGNTIAAVTVTGTELLEALEASTYCTPTTVGGFPQIAGMNIEINTYAAYDANKETYPGSTYYGPASIKRVTIKDINGEPFDPEAKYVVLTNNFCAEGGDTYYAFAAASSQFDTGITLDEALTQYIVDELNGVIDETYANPQGRITFTSATDNAEELINSLPSEITAADKEAVQAARAAYDALTDEEKASLPAGTESKIAAAEAKLAAAEAKQEAANAKDALALNEAKINLKLDTFIAQMSGITAAKYTAATYEPFKTALDAAIETLAKADATLEELTKADNDLTAAQAALKAKSKNPMKVKATAKTVKYTKVKKKKQVVAPLKVTKQKGKVTYAKSSGNKKITVNKKTGKFTVAKGTKKGTYKIKVKVTAAGNGDFKKLTKTVTVTIKVK